MGPFRDEDPVPCESASCWQRRERELRARWSELPIGRTFSVWIGARWKVERGPRLAEFVI